MRIIGYIEHPGLKITVFKMDTRITVKFEDGHYEQAYKFRMSNELNHISHVQQLVDAQFIAGVKEQLKGQHHIRTQAMERFIAAQGEEKFDTII